MKTGIFISYRRSDSAAVAGRIHDRLAERVSDDVFMDVERLHPGTRFRDDIDATLARSGVVLAVIGPHWRQSAATGSNLGDPDDFVTRELAAALAQSVSVIPVLVGGAEPPRAADLPETLRPLADFHALEIRDAAFGRDMDLLEEAVARALGTAPLTALERFLESLPFSFGLRFSQRMRGYHAILAVLFGLLSIVGWALLWFLNEPTDPEFLVAPLAGLYTWAIGRNAMRRRWLAHGGLALSVAGTIGMLVLPANYSAPVPLPTAPMLPVRTSDISADVVLGADFTLSPESPGPGDAWTLEVVLATGPGAEPPPTGWPAGGFLLESPNLRLSASGAAWHRSASTLSRREPGVQYGATFSRFRADLGAFADPRAWQGARVEARLLGPDYACGSADRPRIRGLHGAEGDPATAGPFHRLYGVTEEQLRALAGPDAQDRGLQVTSTAIPATLALVVAGQEVARAEGLMALVCAYQADIGSERYMARFPIATARAPLAGGGR